VALGGRGWQGAQKYWPGQEVNGEGVGLFAPVDDAVDKYRKVHMAFSPVAVVHGNFASTNRNTMNTFLRKHQASLVTLGIYMVLVLLGLAVSMGLL
jgi:hypothetical protein